MRLTGNQHYDVEDPLTEYWTSLVPISYRASCLARGYAGRTVELGTNDSPTEL